MVIKKRLAPERTPARTCRSEDELERSVVELCEALEGQLDRRLRPLPARLRSAAVVMDPRGRRFGSGNAPGATGRPARTTTTASPIDANRP